MRKFLAGLLCLCLLVTMLPVTALAAGEAIDGHERMYAKDGVYSSGEITAGDGTDLAPSRLGYIGAGTTVIYDAVMLQDAKYVNLCAYLDQTAKEDAKVAIYLNDATTPAAEFEFPVSGFHVMRAELNDTYTGEFKVTLKVTRSYPDLSWIQFITEEDMLASIINGHNRVMMADGAKTGYGEIMKNGNDPMAPTHLGYTNSGTTVSFEEVKLTDASYVELYARENGGLTENAIIDIYLDDAETPAATYEFGACEFVSKIAPLSETVSGFHKVTLKIIQSKPDISWIRFLTEEDVKGIATNGHERMMALDGIRSWGEIEFLDNRLAPSILGWIGPQTTISYPYVSLKDAKYVQICTEANGDGNQIDVFVGEEQTEIASFQFDTFKSVHVRTLELPEAITTEDSVTVRVTSGSPNFAWIRFFSEEEYENYNPVKVALIGDSNVEYAPYFNGLASLLDPEEYLVQSYGVSGATVYSYQETAMFKAALDFKADIYIITLGSNDSGGTADQIRANIPQNYKNLIDKIRAVNPDAEIYGQTITPLRSDDNPDGTNPEEPNGRSHKKLVEVSNPLIYEACAEKDVPVIDIYGGLMNAKFSRQELMRDHVHLTAAGGKVMAQIVYDAVFAEDLGEGTAPGTVDAVNITAPKTELTQKGETMTLTADTDVYWKVLSADGSQSSNFATVDADGVVTAVKPGAYLVEAISKADTSVKDTLQLYNRFTYQAAEIDNVFYGENERKRESFDVRDGGVRMTWLNDGITFCMEDVDLTDVTSVTARAAAFCDNVATDATLELHLDAADGPMLASCTVSDTRVVNGNDSLRYGDFKSGMVPVTDGELHDVYAIVNFPTGFSYDLLSISFDTADENPVVVKDGAVVDTYSPNFSWKAGEYTLYSQADSLPVAALYDKDGKVVVSTLLTGEGGKKEASFTLTEAVPGGTLRTFHWSDLASMTPVTPAHLTYQAPLTIGCVGDSIVRETDEPNIYAFPKFLELALGNRYEVLNFGRGGATTDSYYTAPHFADALKADCDIYVIQFGNNDSKSDTDTANFKQNYQRLIDTIREAHPDSVLYLCLPYATFANSYGIRTDIQRDVIVPEVREIAEANGLEVIDLYNPTVHEVVDNDRLGDLYRDDQTHPTVEGMVFIAELVKDGILEK